MLEGQKRALGVGSFARAGQRETEASWRYRVLGPGASITLANGASVPVDAIYEGAFDLEAG